MLKSDIYIKDDNSVLINHNRLFTYEVFVFIHYDNITIMSNHKFFNSTKEIKNIIKCFNFSKHITIECDLYSAPLSWIIDNEFKLYVKPEKKKKIKNEKNN